jgi:hypothetical protein
MPILEGLGDIKGFLISRAHDSRRAGGDGGSARLYEKI